MRPAADVTAHPASFAGHLFPRAKVGNPGLGIAAALVLLRWGSGRERGWGTFHDVENQTGQEKYEQRKEQEPSDRPHLRFHKRHR